MYYCTTPVLNSRVLLMYTDTVTELPGYPVQNSPSGSFLLWGGALGSEGVVYDIVWRRCPRRTPWMMLRTPVCSYPIIVTHLSFNFLCLLLLYSIYLNGKNILIGVDWPHVHKKTPPPQLRWRNRYLQYLYYAHVYNAVYRHVFLLISSHFTLLSPIIFFTPTLRILAINTDKYFTVWSAHARKSKRAQGPCVRAAGCAYHGLLIRGAQSWINRAKGGGGAGGGGGQLPVLSSFLNM